MRILFVAVAGARIGFGHLKRCLSIASVSENMGVAAEFMIFGDERAKAQIGSITFPYCIYPLADMAHADPVACVDAAVLDVIHPRYFLDGNTSKSLFARVRRAAPLLATIDSLGEESLAARTYDIPVDFLVVPYAINDADAVRLSRFKPIVLSGPEYALLASDYSRVPRRKVRQKADRVLVTCGGADPLDWTLLVLSGLERIADELAIRVVVGPLFDRVVRAKLSVAAAVSHHHMEIVDIPESLAKQMQWCDVAVAASGLTKYELAASGTPTVLFSIDAHHDASNSAFAALDITEDLGASPTPERIADATRALLLDRERRERMAQMGQRLIDGKGAERLILKLKERSPEK